MSIVACARMVERHDPDRFLTVMAAPANLRDRLWPLYAYNIEIARAPYVSAEPMVAEMRLQWWVDAVAAIASGSPYRGHEVAGPLGALVAKAALPVDPLLAMAEARRRDVWGKPFADEAALFAYLDATTGNLMWLAAKALGADDAVEPVVRQVGLAMGLSAWFAALPDLVARGRRPLPDMSEKAIARLARRGLAQLAEARRQRGVICAAALPALWPAWQARAMLSRAARSPARVPVGRLAGSEFSRRFGLLKRVILGRF